MNNHNLERIEDLSQEEFDKLPFGAIILDKEGIVLRYNRQESKLSTLDPDYVVGKSFFEEIAPCTKVKEFHEKFIEGVKNKNLFVNFSFMFKFKKGSAVVTITMFYNEDTGNVIIRVDQVGR